MALKRIREPDSALETLKKCFVSYLIFLLDKKKNMWISLKYVTIYQPLRSGRIWYKVNF